MKPPIRDTHPLFAQRARALLACVAAGLLFWVQLPAAAQHGPSGAQRTNSPFVLHAAGRCLEVNEPQLRVNGARVQLGACDGQRNQTWRRERGHIVSMANGRCLDLHDPDAGFNGARVQVWDCHGGPNQTWRFERGQLIAQVDGRCLNVYGTDHERATAYVHTWDCRSGPHQQWKLAELAPPVPQPYDVEAGPLWNTDDAKNKCPAACAPAKWTGQWRTTDPGRMSVCGCAYDAPQPAWPREPVGPRPMQGASFDELLRAMNAEAFPRDKLRVLEAAAREHHFVIAQLQRIVPALSFPQDKIRAVEIVAPRILDRGNSFALYSVLDFEHEKEQVRVIFERLSAQ